MNSSCIEPMWNLIIKVQMSDEECARLQANVWCCGGE